MLLQRRRLLLTAPAVPLALSACGSAAVQTLPTVAAALQAIDGLATGWRSAGTWSLAQVLNHAAQSIEYSMSGFPESKSALFRATVGSAAFALFDAIRLRSRSPPSKPTSAHWHRTSRTARSTGRSTPART